MSSPALQLRERFPRLAEDAVARARLTVVPRRRVRAARMPFVTLVSLVLLGGVVGLLCFNTQMQQASFAATSLETEANNLSARQQTLHDELQTLNDPQQLAVRARSLGMVIGESSRGDEMVVNAVRAKEKNNIRTHSHDDAVKLAAPVVHTLETAIEWIGDDELVEVTPKSIRIRKRHLNLEDRRRAAKRN